jgi:thiaminase/transcriptional activator TenA
MTSPNLLFDQLKANCAQDWKSYIEHDFVRQLGAGTLPEAAFRQYLIQDYLFLIQFARAYALAVYKSETLPDMRQAAASISAILDIEMGLHVEFCAGWGLKEADMQSAPEASACMAYTRFVLERGMAGDLLDLHAALAPCIVGYAEIGAMLAADPDTMVNGNPYMPWIEMYAGDEYQEVAESEKTFLEDLLARRGGPGRMVALSDTFAKATQLEVEFWQMGLDHMEV